MPMAADRLYHPEPDPAADDQPDRVLRDGEGVRVPLGGMDRPVKVRDGAAPPPPQVFIRDVPATGAKPHEFGAPVEVSVLEMRRQLIEVMGEGPVKDKSESWVRGAFRALRWMTGRDMTNDAAGPSLAAMREAVAARLGDAQVAGQPPAWLRAAYDTLYGAPVSAADAHAGTLPMSEMGRRGVALALKDMDARSDGGKPQPISRMSDAVIAAGREREAFLADAWRQPSPFAVHSPVTLAEQRLQSERTATAAAIDMARKAAPPAIPERRPGTAADLEAARREMTDNLAGAWRNR